jgi:Wiskott-Aldrich syndrome protein
MPPRGGGDAAPAPALPGAAASGRGGLLADIRGGARLKKVSDTEKRDRSAAMVPGSEAATGAGAGAGGKAGDAGDAAAAAAGGGLAGALASALAARKSKVSHSGKWTCSLLLLFRTF